MFYIIPKILRYSLKINQKSTRKTNLAEGLVRFIAPYLTCLHCERFILRSSAAAENGSVAISNV